MYEVSDFLREKLTREGKHEAKRQLDRVNEMAGRSQEGAARQFTAASRGVTAQEKRSGVRLVWVNPVAIGKSVNKRAPFPMIEGGRK